MTSKFPKSLDMLVHLVIRSNWHFLLCNNLWKRIEVVVETRYFCNWLIKVCPIVHNVTLVLFPVTFSHCIRCSEQNVPELPRSKKTYFLMMLFPIVALTFTGRMDSVYHYLATSPSMSTCCEWSRLLIRWFPSDPSGPELLIAFWCEARQDVFDHKLGMSSTSHNPCSCDQHGSMLSKLPFSPKEEFCPCASYPWTACTL